MFDEKLNVVTPLTVGLKHDPSNQSLIDNYNDARKALKSSANVDDNQPQSSKPAPTTLEAATPPKSDISNAPAPALRIEEVVHSSIFRYFLITKYV